MGLESHKLLIPMSLCHAQQSPNEQVSPSLCAPNQTAESPVEELIMEYERGRDVTSPCCLSTHSHR